eukprot:CAMPEP_0174254576 /NCGR_PEP_ID=MMETSP0439-20130205/3899_1 /TAXON_ID=0 /ORGANISM="Stereomyxa ramosa, Strain Chinc5" /LENGTH=758 /DNA_ID=CAMNT_0015336243 /DNA_START=196 /DNA_END=2469 /DNA_ORIENTATION=+
MWLKRSDTNLKLPKLSREIIRKLPKVELHCHLDGAVRVRTLIELAKEQKIEDFPTFNEEELRSKIQVTNHCNSLVEYLYGFDITLLVLQKPYAITRVVYEVCEDACKDGVKYIEIRFSPILHTKTGLSLSQVMEAVVEGQAMAEFNLPITVRIIVCGMRHYSPEKVRSIAEIAWRYRNKGVVAFDLAGPEMGFSSVQHSEAFDIIRSQHINCTIHSGEAAGWEYVHDAIRYCGAQRLGHGVAIVENEDLAQFVVDRGIAVEVCLTSNVQTKAVKSIKEHPVRKFFDKGIKVCLSTDNPTISGITLTDEYYLAQRRFKFTPEELIRIIDYGFRSTFLPIYQKSRMRAEAIRQCVQILAAEGYSVNSVLENTSFMSPGLYFPTLFNNCNCLEMSQELTPDEISVVTGATPNPVITEELIKKLPKTDLHCRLDGSLSLEFIFEELNKIDANKFPSLNDLRLMMKTQAGDVYNKKTTTQRRKLITSILQSKRQIIAGLTDIYKSAVEDNIRYMEIMVRPVIHTEKDLEIEDVVDIVLDAKSTLDAEYGITTGIVLYATSDSDMQPVVKETAELAVKHRRNGVCGFGVFGPDVVDVKVDSIFEYCPEVIKFLKDEHMNICIAAGKSSVISIVTAFHDGGANRISGAFSIHKDPELMSYFSLHSIPIELGLTDSILHYTQDVKVFAHPIKLFLDNDLKVTICSFDATFNKGSRSEMLYKIVSELNLSVLDLYKLIGIGFRKNFQNFDTRLQLYSDFQEIALSLL